jgi:hypothetical protein
MASFGLRPQAGATIEDYKKACAKAISLLVTELDPDYEDNLDSFSWMEFPACVLVELEVFETMCKRDLVRVVDHTCTTEELPYILRCMSLERRAIALTSKTFIDGTSCEDICKNIMMDKETLQQCVPRLLRKYLLGRREVLDMLIEIAPPDWIDSALHPLASCIDVTGDAPRPGAELLTGYRKRAARFFAGALLRATHPRMGEESPAATLVSFPHLSQYIARIIAADGGPVDVP